MVFDGSRANASAAGGTFARSYGATVSGAGIDVIAGDQRVALTHAWDGDVLVITVPSGPWAGIARLRPAAR